MKRVILIFTIILSNVTLFSCTTSEVADEIGTEVLATEGEDGDLGQESSEEDEG